MGNRAKLHFRKFTKFDFGREVPINNLISFLATLNYAFVFSALMDVYMGNLFYDLPYPQNTFLSPPEGRFGDLYSVNNSWLALGFSGIGFGHSYFPGMYLILEIFHRFNLIFQWPGIWTLLICLCLSVILYCLINIKFPIFAFVAANLFIFSYPVLLMWSTGNVEAFIGILLILGTFLLKRERLLSFALILGLAGSAKAFPLVFLFVLFYIRDFRSALRLFLVGLSSAAVVSLTAITFLRGGLLYGSNDIRKIWSNSQESRSMYAQLMYYSEGSIPFGHSFLNGIHSVFGMSVIRTEDWALVTAILISFLLFMPSLFFAWKKKYPTWQVLSLLGAWTLVIAPTSTDYRLVYFWPALLLLFTQKSAIRSDMLLATYIIIILAPKPYFSTEIHPQATMSVYVTSLMILCLPLVVVLCNRLSVKENIKLLSEKYAK